MIIAAWNIEKCGLSSSTDKQAALDTFLFECAYAEGDNTPYADLIFLCEVHGARVDDFVEFLTDVYGHHYYIGAVDGNYSNNYVYMIRQDCYQNDWIVPISTWRNERPMLTIQCALSSGTAYVGLLHAKSGQTGLTKRQLNNAMAYLDTQSRGRWMLTGDLNWDVDRVDQLTLPLGADSTTCWIGPTQRRGGVLDWALVCKYLAVTGNSLSLTRNLDDGITDFSNMDHRPVIFSVR